MKIIYSALLAGSLLTSPFAFADAASEQEAANLLDTMNMDVTLEQTLSNMLDAQLEQQPALVPYKDVLREFFEKYMSYEALKPEFIKIYGDTFTASELKEINAFYSTDVGKKTIKVMPELAAKGARIGMKHVQDHTGELQAMIKAEKERLEKNKKP